MKKVLFGVMILVAIFAVRGAELAAATPTIALLDSDLISKAYFNVHYRDCPLTAPDENGIGANEYRRYFLGWKYVLDHAAFPPNNAPLVEGTDYMVIHDAAITDGTLDQFKLLILSNNASLSDEQTKAIQKWVIGGGRLLATFGSGYEDVVTSTAYPVDDAKLQKGHTNGLHELWRDPLTKDVTTQAVAPTPDPDACQYGGAVELMLGNSGGPVGNINVPFLLGYGDNGNLLTQRPLNDKNAYGWLVFKNNLDQFGVTNYEGQGPLCSKNFSSNDIGWKRNMPAILANSAGKGQVVYYAFAPEFIVSLEFDLAGHCSGIPAGTSVDPNYRNADSTPCVNSPAAPTVPSPCALPAQANDYSGRTTSYLILMANTITYLMNGL